MKRRGFWAALCALGLSAAMLCGCARQTLIQPVKLDNRPTVTVGCDNYPPYSYDDYNGKPTGIDVDLATEAFSRMGYRAVFLQIDWEEKRELLAQGVIDCIWSSFSIDGREDDYRWSGPYMVSRQVIAVREDSDITTLADLEGKRVAVQSTTKPEEIFLAGTDTRIPKFRDLISLTNRELLYPFLSKGYVDAIAAHETAILQCMKDYGLHYRILEEPLLTVGLGVAFDKSDERGLDRELNEAFQSMREDGTMEQIIGNYLDNPLSYMEVNQDEE